MCILTVYVSNTITVLSNLCKKKLKLGKSSLSLSFRNKAKKTNILSKFNGNAIISIVNQMLYNVYMYLCSFTHVHVLHINV